MVCCIWYYVYIEAKHTNQQVKNIMATKKTKQENVEVVEENFMRLEQYIGLLQEVLKKEGNVPVTYSTDDEGNSYGFVRYAPTPMLYEGNLNGMKHHLEVTDKETVAKTKQKAFKAVCVN